MRPRSYARITLACLVLLALIVVTGAAVRLTGSGLGCPDWPTCENDRVVAPLEYHAWVEFGNRLVTGVVAVAVMVGVLGALVRSPRRRDLTWLSISLVLGVIGQAVLGGISVLHRLDPKYVMAHFLLSMAIIWAAVVLHHRAREDDGRRVPVTSAGQRLLARAMGAVGGIVLLVGTMVTGTGPHGGDEHVHRLGFAPHAITKVHGAFVWLLVLLTVASLWGLKRSAATSTLVRRGEVVMVALLVQAAIGYFQYATDLPPMLVLLHVAGATAVWIALLWYNLGFFETYGAIDLAVHDDERGGLPSADDLAAAVGPGEPLAR